MNFLISLILAYIFCVTCKKSLKSNAPYFYLASSGIAWVVVYMTIPENAAGEFFNNMFKYGTFGTALITLVMFMNAVPNGHKFQKDFMVIRGELSIIASILFFAHNIAFGQRYLLWLFTDIEQFEGNVPKILATVLTTILIAMLIPLFLTSFKTVRKKMKPKKWKQLQKMAYPFYMLIYYHVLLLMLPRAIAGDMVYIINVIIYTVVFNGYAIMRIMKAYAKNNTPQLQLAMGIVFLCQTLVVLTSCIL